MKKVIIVSGIQVSDNPRVVKEATTLANAGYDVEVLCSLLNPAQNSRNLRLAEGQRFRVHRVLDVSRSGLIPCVDWHWRRLRRRVALVACRTTGGESVHQLGYAAKDLLKACLRRPADLYSIHLPQAMWVGAQLIRLGAKVSVDIEDWYSEDFRSEELSCSPVRLLRSVESSVLKGATFASTTSNALRDALTSQYECQAPIVLYNAFRLSERRLGDTPPHEQPVCSGQAKIGWVSQVIGPDRGLEQLLGATHYVRHPVDIHLTGRLRPGIIDTFSSMLHSSCTLFFHDQVPHEQLLPLMQTYDLGFAGELADSRNKDLTASNKLLHYLLAGIPVVASDTLGQLEICRQAPAATRVYAQRDPESLAAAIDSLLERPEVLRNAKKAAWDAGSTTFCWEANEPRLLDAVHAATR